MKNSIALKILAIALSVCMLLTAAPLSGFIGLKLPELKLPESFKAALANIAGDVADIGNEASAATVASGFCGDYYDNLTWTLDDAGLLTIDGTGKMLNWSDFTFVPWYIYHSSVKQVKISSRITSIGDYAFYNCGALTKIDLSACTGLTSIGYWAFFYCSALTKIDLSACTKLSSIGQDAFAGCSTLTEIRISSDVCSIDNNARAIPANTVIYCNAGSGAQAYARKYNRTYKALDGHSHQLSATAIAPSCILPGHTTHICSVCSETVYIKNITPATGHMDSDADGVCDICNSAYVAITASGACGENLVWSLDGNGLLTIEGNGAIGTWLSDSNAPWYSNRSSIKHVKIGSGISSIKSRVFEDCANLTDINVASDNQYFASADGVLFNKAKKELICYPCSKTDITYTVPASVTEIYDYAFAACRYLKEIDLSGCTELSSIGEPAFNGCSALTDISIAADNPYFTNSGDVLFNKTMTNLIYYPLGKTDISYTVPDSVTRICSYAFYYDTKLKEIDFSACTELISIGDYAFYEVAIPGLNLSPCTVLKHIGNYAFSWCRSLTNINFSGLTALKSIGDYAFKNCRTLTTVNLSSCTNLTKIGYETFSGCTALTTVGLSGCTALTSIGTWTFQECTVLTEIDLLPCTALTSIGTRTFENCTALTKIDLSDCTNLTRIGYNPFPGCNTLKEIDLSGCTKLDSINSSDFSGCTALETVKIGNADCRINNNATTFPSDVVTIYGHPCSTAKAYATKYERTFVAFDGEPTQHKSPGNWVTKTVATCSTTGLETRSCPRCLEVLETREIATLGHTWNAGEVTTAPTCTETGVKTFTCTECSTTTTETIAANGHTWDAGVITTAPTCSAAGVKTFACSRCSATKTEAVFATGHTVVNDAAVEPTCTMTGLTAGTHCSVCDAVITAQIEIEALGHDTVAHEAQAATCTEIGWASYDTCSRCDYTTYVKIEALGHDTVAHEAQTATCTEIGWDAYDTCSRCDYTTYEEIEALGHDTVAHVAKAATCTEIGWDAYDTCSRCDYTTYEEIEALGHTYTSAVTAPTCTEGGYTTYNCSNCGDSYTADATAALGHTEETIPGVAPTCTETGLTDGVKCSVCEEIITAQLVIAASGHTWNEGTITTAPTCTETGVKTFICTECSASTTETIAAKGHTVVTDAAVAATCTETGLTEGSHCSDCGEIFTAQTVVDVLDHVWNEWTTITESTCTSGGERSHTCINCGKTVIEATSATMHYDRDGDSRCDSCGKQLSSECFWTLMIRAIRTVICTFIREYFSCCSCKCIRALCKDCP